jgi:oligoendopeptidase F
VESLKNQLGTKEGFLKYLDLSKQLGNNANKLATYTHLGDVDQTATIYQELEGLLINEYQKISIKTSFVEPELKQVGREKIFEFLADEQYQQYRLDYELFFEQAQHVLSAHDEELLSKVSLSRGSIGAMYDSLAFADNQEVQIE